MRNLAFAILFVLVCWHSSVHAQEEPPTHRVELVRAAYLSKEHPYSVGALFMVTATDTLHFPPVLSMGIGYAVNGDSLLQRIDIGKDPLRRVSIEVYGKDISEKAPNIHSRIKGRVDMEAHEHLLFLFIRMRNISDEPIREIEIEYGLWEKQDLETRIEKRFRAMVGN